MSEFYSDITVDLGEGYPIFAFVHLAYANSANGETDFTIEPKDGVLYTYLGQYSDNNRIASTEPSAYAWALLSQEEQRAAAEKARVQNETAREKAESARASAETTRADNEKIRNSNENARITNEDTRKSNETSRVNAEETRTNNELKRAENENTRIGSESARVTAETNRATAESNRSDAETKRVSAESARTTAETNRVSAEKTRSDAETKRVSAETSRVSAETKRVSAETTRATNETNRVNAESKRVSAETARETASATAVSNANTAATNAQKVADTIADSLSAEVTERTDADTKLQQDINSIAPTRSACSDTFWTMTDMPDSLDYFEHQKLLNIAAAGSDGVYYDVTSIVNESIAKTILYYANIYTAVDDINAGNFSNGSTTASSTGVKVVTYALASGYAAYTYTSKPHSATVLQLLEDVTLTKILKISASCFVDLNGHKINVDLGTMESYNAYMTFGIFPTVSCASLTIYGIKKGSGINFTLTQKTSSASNTEYYGMYIRSTAFTIIGGEYTLNVTVNCNEISLLAYFGGSTNSGTSNDIYLIEDATFNIAVSGTTQYGYNCMYSYLGRDSSAILKNVTINDASTGTVGNSSGACIQWQESACKGAFIMTGCNISTSSKATSSVQSRIGIITDVAMTYIADSHISASNCAFEGGGYVVYICNSILEGGEHGGLYANYYDYPQSYEFTTSGTTYRAVTSTIPMQRAIYVQDSIVRNIANTSGYHNNGQSCYCGYGSRTCFNNVTFDSYSGSLNGPTLKNGCTATDKNGATIAYFSNCKLKRIRVDSGCTAIFGAGIDDSIRNTSVSGTIKNTVKKIYKSSLSIAWPIFGYYKETTSTEVTE